MPAAALPYHGLKVIWLGFNRTSFGSVTNMVDGLIYADMCPPVCVFLSLTFWSSPSVTCAPETRCLAALSVSPPFTHSVIPFHFTFLLAACFLLWVRSHPSVTSGVAVHLYCYLQRYTQLEKNTKNPELNTYFFGLLTPPVQSLRLLDMNSSWTGQDKKQSAAAAAEFGFLERWWSGSCRLKPTKVWDLFMQGVC